MAKKFKVGVPVEREGDSGGSGKGKSKGDKENTTAIKGLTKAIALGNVIAQTLSGVTDGLKELFSPLIRILSALLVIAFLPLLPLLTKLTTGLADFTFDVSEAGGGIKGLLSALAENFDSEDLLELGPLMAALVIASFVLGLSTVLWGALILGAIAEVGPEIADDLVESIGEFWVSVLTIALLSIPLILAFAFGGWALALAAIFLAASIAFGQDMADAIKQFFVDLKSDLSEDLKSIIGIGKMIVDAVKSALLNIPVVSLGSKVVSAVSSFIKGDFVQRPGQSAVSFSAQDTIIGVKDPSALGGGGTTININNPVIREEPDLKKLAELMGRKLQSLGNRRFSSV